MNYRINTRAILLVIVLVLIAIGLFAYTLVTAPTDDELPPRTPETEETPTERLITAQHQFRDGLHTIAGETEVPTPCHTLLVDPFLTESNTQAELRFSTLLEGEACPQVITTETFQISFNAPEDVELTARFNGDPARLNLIPVGLDEELDTDVFIKG